MVKSHKRLTSVLLSVLLVISMCCLPVTGVSAATTTEEVEAYTDDATVSATSSKYSTNPGGKIGKKSSITIDGEFNDWSEDMLIAQGAAWDVANHWKGGHENCVLDTYSLYGAWDDDNLYVAWQMVNTTDTWAREGDGPLSDGGRVLDVPLILALSVDPSSVSMTNKNTSGGSIWGQKMGVTFDTHVDHLLYMSGKPGLGEPSLFKAADAQGNTSYVAPYATGFAAGGIEYKMKEGFLPSSLIGLNYSDDPSDINDDSADWVDYLTFEGSSGKHNTKYDSFYEIKIPLSLLGIDASELQSNGIGAMLLATRGESALDCIPHDPSMVDNATGSYSSDPSTSAEKDDIDNITVDFARIGGDGSTPTPKPTTTTQKTTTTTQKTTQKTTTTTQKVTTPVDGVTGKTSVTVKAGETVEYKVKLKNSAEVMGFNTKVLYDKAALRLDTSYGDDGAAAPNFSGSLVINGAELASQGRLAAVGSASATQLADFTTEKDLLVVKFTALKDTTTDISYIMKELMGFDEVNMFDSSYQPISSAVSSRCTASVSSSGDTTTPLPSNVTGQTTVNVKTGDTVEYVISLKNIDPIIGFNLRANYDTSVLTLDLDYGDEGVEYPNFAGSVTVNGAELASEGRVAVVASGSDYQAADFTAEKDLVVVRFTALKDATTTISYLMKDLRGIADVNLFDEITGKPLSSDTVTNNSAKVIGEDTTKISSNNEKPVTGGKIIDVTKGDVLRYEVSLNTPEEIAAWNIWVSYDENMLAIDETFGDEGLATNQGIPYALGEDDSFGQATDDNTVAYNGLTNTYSVSAADQAGYPGYTNGQRALIVQFVAKETGRTTLTHWVGEITSITKNDYADIYGSGKVINGAVVTDEVVFVEETPKPTTIPSTTPKPTTAKPTTIPSTTPKPTTAKPTTPKPTTVPATTTTQAPEIPTLPSVSPDGVAVTGGSVVYVHEGDTVTYEISLKAPGNMFAITMYNYFDSNILELDTTFGTGGCQRGVKFGAETIVSPKDGLIAMAQSSAKALVNKFTEETVIMTVKYIAKADGYATIYYSATDVLASNNADIEDAFNYYRDGAVVVEGASMSDKPTVDCPHNEIMLGDVNFDTKVDLYDAVLVQKHCALLVTLEGDAFIAGDVNRDGEIDMKDVVLIRQRISWLITEF